MKYLNTLSDSDIMDMIDDYMEFQHKTGVLSSDSKLCELIKTVCKDYEISFDLNVGIKVFLRRSHEKICFT